MPTYSYACTQCDNRFDVVQSFTDEPLSECSVCSGKLRKLFNSVGIVFKGSGFYRTDSRSGSVPTSDSSAKSETPSSSESSSNGSTGDGQAKKSDSGSSTDSSSAPTAAAT